LEDHRLYREVVAVHLHKYLWEALEYHSLVLLLEVWVDLDLDRHRV
jgi:hypothetical protein